MSSGRIIAVRFGFGGVGAGIAPASTGER